MIRSCILTKVVDRILLDHYSIIAQRIFGLTLQPLFYQNFTIILTVSFVMMTFSEWKLTWWYLRAGLTFILGFYNLIFSWAFTVFIILNMFTIIVVLSNILIGQISYQYSAAQIEASIQSYIYWAKLITGLDRSIFTCVSCVGYCSFVFDSFMMEIPIIKSMEWFLYDRDLRYERVNLVQRFKCLSLREHAPCFKILEKKQAVLLKELYGSKLVLEVSHLLYKLLMFLNLSFIFYDL